MASHCKNQPSVKYFNIAFAFIAALFFSMLLFVFSFAFTRQSGQTGMDPTTIQKIRYQSNHLQQP